MDFLKIGEWILFIKLTLIVILQLSMIRFELHALKLHGLAPTTELTPHEELFDNRLWL